MSEKKTREQIIDRLAKYYAWKLIIEQIEKIFLPEAKQVEHDFERWYGQPSRSGMGDLYSGLLIAIARSRRHRLEAHVLELRDRFATLFGRDRLPTS